MKKVIVVLFALALLFGGVTATENKAEAKPPIGQ